MKNLFTTAVFTLFFGITLYAQNLVPNGSFEVQDSCPLVSELHKAQPWNSPTMGSPDLFNTTCAQQQGDPRTGIGSAGIFCYSTFADNREYMQVKLSSPLIAGQSYYVSFYVMRDDFFKNAINRMGAYLSKTKINETSTGVLAYTPQIQNPVNRNLTSSSNWTQISGVFQATGGEEYLVIGNFYTDANTTVTPVGSSGSNHAYYNIDDVSIISGTTGITENNKNLIGLNIYPNPASTALNIQLAAGVSASRVSILNKIGQEVKSVDVSVDYSGMINIPISDLTSDIYFVQVNTSEGISCQRVHIKN